MELARGNEFETLQQRFEVFRSSCRLVPRRVPQTKIEVSNQQAYVDRVKEKNRLGKRCTEFSLRLGPGISHPRVVAEDAGEGDFATGNVEPAYFVPGVGPTVVIVQCRRNL